MLHVDRFISERIYDISVDMTKLSKTNDSCRAIKTKGMVFRYTWVYSKEDTMAHTYRAVVTS